MICGQSPLHPRQFSKNNLATEIRQQISDYYQSEDLLDNLNYLIFNQHMILSKSWGEKINSYDLPALEFIFSNYIRPENNDMFSMAKIDFETVPWRERKLTKEELLERCFTLDIMSRQHNALCLWAYIQKYPGILPYEYLHKVEKMEKLKKLLYNQDGRPASN